jgi:hypothetical protein
MKIQTLFHRAERPLRFALAALSTAFALILLGAAWFEPARPETGMQRHPHPADLNTRTHLHIHASIVTGLVQIIGRAI